MTLRLHSVRTMAEVPFADTRNTPATRLIED